MRLNLLWWNGTKVIMNNYFFEIALKIIATSGKINKHYLIKILLHFQWNNLKRIVFIFHKIISQSDSLAKLFWIINSSSFTIYSVWSSFFFTSTRINDSFVSSFNLLATTIIILPNDRTSTLSSSPGDWISTKKCKILLLRTEKWYNSNPVLNSHHSLRMMVMNYVKSYESLSPLIEMNKN